MWHGPMLVANVNVLSSSALAFHRKARVNVGSSELRTGDRETVVESNLA